MSGGLEIWCMDGWMFNSIAINHNMILVGKCVKLNPICNNFVTMAKP